MRGEDKKQSSMLCLMSLEERVPKDHPLRGIKKLADEALGTLSNRFDRMYARGGRPSVPPERLLKAMLLIALYSVRSERQFCEMLQYNLLFRWFLDMDMVEEAFDATTFTHNRERLLKHDVAGHFFAAVVEKAKQAGLMSTEHFSVDGTLIEAWASMKSFRPKDDDDDDQDSNGWADFKGQKRSNDTHESKTDPESKLWRKGDGQPAKLCFQGSALMENRNGLLVEMRVTAMSGTAERENALAMLKAAERSERATVGADRAFDVTSYVEECRAAGITPHVAQQITTHRGSKIDGRTTRWPGYEISQRVRRRIESIFGWCKTIGGLRRTRVRGVARTNLAALIAGAAYNLTRITKLLPELAT
jgi:transposase